MHLSLVTHIFLLDYAVAAPAYRGLSSHGMTIEISRSSAPELNTGKFASVLSIHSEQDTDGSIFEKHWVVQWE
ncbi:MAG: hypothetical protein CL912_09400 [Deltaproteobacteria bacterium]|nr:hypothetical protein [Deltaproteobacteria bacterium]